MESRTPKPSVRVRRRPQSGQKPRDARPSGSPVPELLEAGDPPDVARESEPSSAPAGRSSKGISVRFEDADVVVLERSPTSSAQELRRHLGRREGPRARQREASRSRAAWPVGSIEVGLTGLVLLARSARARRALERDPELEVRYLAAVEERPERPEREGAARARPGARADEPRVVGRRGVQRLLEFERRRAHRDLRTWLERRGFRPLRDPDHPERIYLHATGLSFSHPASGKSMRFEMRPPEDLIRAGGKLSPAEPALAPAEALAAPPRRRERSEGTGPDAGPRPPSDRARREQRPQSRPQPRVSTPPLSTDWNDVADWFDVLLEDKEHDHYRDVIVPGTLRLLEISTGQRVLDVASGQGQLCRILTERGAEAVGVEASARLVERARERSAEMHPRPTFHEGDARRLDALRLGRFHRISCIMALSNIDPIGPVLAACADLLHPGGAFVAVIAHPSFRIPQRSRWEWQVDADGTHRQFRQVDAYRSHARIPIVANPGAVSRGARPIETWTFHRPLEHYVTALSAAGLWIDRIEEWVSRRESRSGPRAPEENRARREIPLFMAIRARRVPPQAD